MQKGNLALEFIFKCCEVKCFGYNSRQSLEIVSEEYKRMITAIAIRKRIDEQPPHRRYYFNDGTSFILKNGEFQINRFHN